MPSCVEDVGAGAPVGGRGQRQPRHFGMIVEQRLQLAIVGPEVVTPFADAMGFVDRDQREVHPFDKPPEALESRPLRRNVEQVELAVPEPRDGTLAIAVRAGQRRRADAERLRASNLIVHQRD